MKYHAIVADPPWPYPGGFNGWGSRRPLPYQSMSIDAICALPVAELLEREGYLFLWTTQRHMEAGFQVVRAWRCVPKQILTWCKQPMGSGLGGMFATTTEFIIVAQAVGPAGKSHKRTTTGVRVPTSWFEWRRPYDGRGKPMHSAKPEGLQDLVEQIVPGPYLEMFARRQRLGWDTYGDQALCHVDLKDASRG